MTFLAPCYYVFKHLILLALLILSSCGAGLGAAKLLKFQVQTARLPKLEEIFFLFCLGLGVWSYAIFVLGLCHLIYKLALTILFFFSLSPYITLLKLAQPPTFKPSHVSKQTWCFIALLTVIVVPVFARSLYCATGWDDTMYHLPVATAFLNSHHLVLTPFLRYVVFNNFTNLLFIPLLAAGGDTAAQQLSVASFIFCGIGIYALLRRFNSANAGLIGLLAWSSAPFFYELGSTALVDMNLALMGLAGVFAGLKVFTSEEQKERNQNATLAGIFLGCTVASKLLGALLVASFIASANAFNFAARKLQTQKIKNDLIASLKMLLWAGLIISPWLIRSYVETGNPIWPFAEKIFGVGNLWSAADYKSQADSLAATKGIGRSISNFLILPWLMSFKSSQYEQLAFTPFLCFGIYLGVPLLFMKGFRSTKIILGTVTCFLLLWFVSTQQVRYLMAVAPAMCILAGAVLDRYLNAFVMAPRLRNYILGATTVVVLFTGFEHTAYAEMRNDSHRLPYNKLRRSAYSNSRLPMLETMNIFSVLHKGKIYGLALENLQYFANGQMIGDWFGPARYEDFAENCTTGTSLYKYLNRLDVKYLAVDLNLVAHFNLPKDDTFKQHFKNIYTDGKGVIYELQD